MKKHLKVFLVLLALTALTATLLIVSSAAAKTPDFTITSADGTVTEYFESDFISAFARASDGDTVTLLSQIEIGAATLTLSGRSEDAKRTVNLDLAGYSIISLVKTNLFSVGSNNTLNVYSSKENAFLYVAQRDDMSRGGSVFNLSGNNSYIYFGSMTVGDNVYPGSNITTYSSAAINIGGSGTCGFYGDGGTHIANIADWNGFISARDSCKATLSLKNSNIIARENKHLIYSVSKTSEILFENCSVIRLDGTDALLFAELSGTVGFKNCVSNYSINSKNSVETGSVVLEGENIFSSRSSNLDFIADIEENAVMARVNHDYKFASGEATLNCFGDYGSETPDVIEMPTFNVAAVFTSLENAKKYIWTSEQAEDIEEYWLSSENVTPPYDISGKMQEGYYKPGWYYVEEDGVVTCYGGTRLDFTLKASVEYDDYLVMHIYIPAYIGDGAHLDYMQITLNGDNMGRKAWTRVEKDGEEYYMTTTVDLTMEPEKTNTLILVCDFDKMPGIKTAWQISVPEYFEKINSNKEAFTSEELETARELEEKIFG